MLIRAFAIAFVLLRSFIELINNNPEDIKFIKIFLYAFEAFLILAFMIEEI